MRCLPCSHDRKRSGSSPPVSRAKLAASARTSNLASRSSRAHKPSITTPYRQSAILPKRRGRRARAIPLFRAPLLGGGAELVGRGAVLGVGGDADRERQRQVEPLAREEAVLAEDAAEPPRGALGAVAVGPEEHDLEAVRGGARDEVDLAHGADEDARRLD